jgi:hypothetical protein
MCHYARLDHVAILNFPSFRKNLLHIQLGQYREEFEDTKVVIRIRKSKDRHHNGKTLLNSNQ